MKCSSRRACGSEAQQSANSPQTAVKAKVSLSALCIHEAPEQGCVQCTHCPAAAASQVALTCWLHQQAMITVRRSKLYSRHTNVL